MKKSALTTFVLALPVMWGAPTFAGIVDTALPELAAGKTTYHLYSVSGVNGGGGAQFGTYFSCTSTDSTPIQVGVQIFVAGGGGPANDAAATSLSVGPGQTVLFGTLNGGGFILNSDLNVLSGLAGSARILATSKKLICSAFLADRLNSPPTSMVYLTMVSKLKQRGE